MDFIKMCTKKRKTLAMTDEDKDQYNKWLDLARQGGYTETGAKVLLDRSWGFYPKLPEES